MEETLLSSRKKSKLYKNKGKKCPIVQDLHKNWKKNTISSHPNSDCDLTSGGAKLLKLWLEIVGKID